MAQTKTEIQSILSRIGGAPRHRFGQNFMIDGNLVRLVADAGRIRPGDTVVEIGPGTGTLTEELLDRAGPGGRVIAVEIDRFLAESLRHRFAGDRRFELIEGDALAGKHRLNPSLAARLDATPTRLVANLPYNIASPLVVEMLLAGVDLLAFTVQKEVAQRLRASAGQPAYGPLSVVVQLSAEVEVLRTLPPEAFWPMPQIDSALVRISRRQAVPADARAASQFIHQLFSARRKTLRKALRQAGYEAEAAIERIGLDGAGRPETLRPEDFLALWRALTDAPAQ